MMIISLGCAVIFHVLAKRIILALPVSDHKIYKTIFVCRSRIRKEPHLLVGAGAGAVTRCGSGSNSGIYHG
jgi:hypothetical protein